MGTMLGIEDATIGFDTKGIDKVLSEVKVEVIDKAQKKMNDSYDTLIEKVNEVWQGQSALNFKKLMEFHKDTVASAIGSCYGILRGEMVEIMNAMSELDEQLITFNGGEK